MNILFVHPNLSRYASKQIRALSKESGIETYLLCGHPDVSVYNMDDLRKICREVRPDLPVLRYPYQYRSVARQIASLVHEWEIDVVNVYSMPDDLAVAAIEADAAPVVYSLRDITSTFSSELLASRVFPEWLVSRRWMGAVPRYLVSRYIRSMEKQAMEQSQARVYSTPCMLRYAREHYDVDDNNLVFLNYILQEELPGVEKEKRSETEGGTHIGFAGNIDIHDTYRNFLPFFIAVAKEKIHVHMHVVAKDEASKQACRRAAERYAHLHYYPPMSPSDVIAALTAYDFGILPFHTERGYYDNILPNKLFDYLAAGLPIVSSPVKCLRQFIEDNEVGFVYHDAAELASMLRSTDPAAYKVERSTFLMENHIDSLINLFTQIA
ncbi:MAG: glycosyltransferase [Thermoplasmatota archaeon]